MKKNLLILAVCSLIFVLAGCGKGSSENQAPLGEEPTKNADQSGLMPKSEKAKTQKKAEGIADVCNYFPKELVEQAIGKPIVKTESPFTPGDTCDYYTSYSETYNHSPSGGTPGGPHVVVVYDTKDFAKDKAYNETHGTKYETDPSIGMDNYVMLSNAKRIWQTALVLGDDKYIRIKVIDDAVTGDDLVKIAKIFAEKINAK